MLSIHVCLCQRVARGRVVWMGVGWWGGVACAAVVRVGSAAAAVVVVGVRRWTSIDGHS